MNGQAPRNTGSLQQVAVKVGLFLHVSREHMKQEIKAPYGFRITNTGRVLDYGYRERVM